MNFPLNEQNLRASVHEAVEKESFVNLIILLMILRVVQVVSFLRPGERDIKTIAAKDVKITMDDGREFAAVQGVGLEESESADSLYSRPAVQAMISGSRVLVEPDAFPGPTGQAQEGLVAQLEAIFVQQNAILRQTQRQAQVDTTLNTNAHGERYHVDAWSRNPAGFYSLLRVYQNGSADVAHVSPWLAEAGGMLYDVPEVSERTLHTLLSHRPGHEYPERNLRAYTHALEDMYRDFVAGYGPFDRDRDFELTIAQSGQSEYLPEWTTDHDGRATYAYKQDFDILAYCVTTCGQVQILHRTPNGNLQVSVYEGAAETIKAPEISSVYLSFLVAQDDHVTGRRPYRMERHFGDVSGYCTPHRNYMTGRRPTGQSIYSNGRGSLLPVATRGFPSSYGEA